MWISGPTEGLENIFLLLQSTSNPDKRVYAYEKKLTFHVTTTPSCVLERGCCSEKRPN